MLMWVVCVVVAGFFWLAEENYWNVCVYYKNKHSQQNLIESPCRKSRSYEKRKFGKN